VQGLRRGRSTRELAEQLGISSVTVRRHVSALHQKLGTASRDELSRLLLDGVGAS
jgi:DNA-binding CsgD family transcriptional regulator